MVIFDVFVFQSVLGAFLIKVFVVLEKEHDLLCLLFLKIKKLCLLEAVVRIKCAEKKQRHEDRLGFHLFLGNSHLNSARVSLTSAAIKCTSIHTCASSQG